MSGWESVVLLDGAVGTELERLGVDGGGPGWTARAPLALVESVHRAYDAAGAEVHTANTFRTTPRAMGAGWQPAAAAMVAAARRAARGRVAGSLAPLEDCWHPERSPAAPEPEHREIAAWLARCGVDLILCETFAHPGEALAAARVGLATGLETWVSFTAGPDGELLGADAMEAAAREAVELGAARVLVNCVHAARIAPFVEAVARAGAPFGVYANAGLGAEALSPEAYARIAEGWVAAGATAVGGCCGTGPEHIRALRALRQAAAGGRATPVG